MKDTSLRVVKWVLTAVVVFAVVSLATRFIVEKMILDYGPSERFPLIVYVLVTALVWTGLRYGTKAISNARRVRGRCSLCQARSDVDKHGVCVDTAVCDERRRLSRATSQSAQRKQF